MSSWRDADEVERFLGELFDCVRGETLRVLATERFERFNPRLPWIYLADETGVTVGVAWGDEVGRPGVITRSVYVARRLREHPLGERFQVVEGFSRVAPAAQRVLRVLGDKEGLAVRFGAVDPLCYRRGLGYSPITEAILLESAASIVVSLRGLTVALQRGSTVFFDSIVLRSRGRRFSSRTLRREGAVIYLDVEEQMNGGEPLAREYLDEGVLVEVDIGAFELKLQELLTLRPGSTLELPCGAPVRGILKLEGADIGFVTLGFKGDTLVATVEELTLFPEFTSIDEKSGNGELILPNTSLEDSDARADRAEFQLEEL
ncbi:MAG: hypothetical protein RL417_2184 [Pseudomonadota bacterium]